MGTRSLTRIFDEDGKELCCIYRQMDGYPDGHGQELADFLKGFNMVNGLGGEKGKVANGYGCLAAQAIAHLKDGPGSIYLYPAGIRDCGESYEYHVRPGAAGPSTSGPVIAVFEAYGKRKKLFECKPEEYDNLLTTYEALATNE